MGQFKIKYKDADIPLICEAFTRMKMVGSNGQIATPAEVRGYIIKEIKSVVKAWQMEKLRLGKANSMSQAELNVDVEGEE